jgi:hypothetical protein
MSATATAAAEPRQGRSDRVRERLRGRWVWPAGYAAAAALFFLCCLRLAGTQPVTSDPASIALQAWNMLHGNWLLTGWSLADVTFYTTELPEYKRRLLPLLGIIGLGCIFGQPAHVYHVGSQFTVMTYDYNLLDRSPGA